MLAKEKAGAELIMRESGITKFLAAMKVEKNEEISLAAIRAFGELCKNNVPRVCSFNFLLEFKCFYNILYLLI